MRGNQLQSVEIGCNQRQSVVKQRLGARGQSSKAIRARISGNQSSSDVTDDQSQPEPICETMRGNQRQSVEIGCNQRQSVVEQRLGGVNHRRQSVPVSVAIRAHQTIRANQSQSETMRGNQRQSVEIRCNQRQSVVEQRLGGVNHRRQSVPVSVAISGNQSQSEPI